MSLWEPSKLDESVTPVDWSRDVPTADGVYWYRDAAEGEAVKVRVHIGSDWRPYVVTVGLALSMVIVDAAELKGEWGTARFTAGLAIK